MRRLALVLAALAALAALSGCGGSGGQKGPAPHPKAGAIAFVEHIRFTHPGDRGTWSMTGAISDSGTYIRACVDCSSGAGNLVDLRGTYRGKYGTFVLLTHVRPARTSWTLLSGSRAYADRHGAGTCITKIIVNEVSARSDCKGAITR
jgi:predicted small lipoprotein YifL